MIVLDGNWGLLEDATHLIISIGLNNLMKIKITHGCVGSGAAEKLCGLERTREGATMGNFNFSAYGDYQMCGIL